MKSKQITILFLSFIILFAISCGEAAYAPAEVGDLVSSVPDADTSGGQASGLTVEFYSGTFTRTELKVSPENQTSVASGIFPESYSGTDAKVAILADNKVSGGGPMSMLVGAPIYKSGSNYEASFENSEQGAKTYIKFSISGDTLTVIQYTTGASIEGISMQATYTATLTKDTSSTTGG